MHIFIIRSSCFCPSEPNAKPAGGGIADLATTSDPTKPPPEAHQATAGAAGAFSSPSDKTPPAPQQLVLDAPAAPSNTVPTEAPLESPASQQHGPHPQGSAASSHDTTQGPPRAEEEPQACSTANGASSDSAESSVLTPSPLTDPDLREAALDGTSSTEPDKMGPEGPTSSGVSTATEGSLAASTDGVSQRRERKPGESGDKTTSGPAEAAQKRGKEPKLIIVKTLCRDEVVTHRHLDAQRDEGIAGWDMPDGAPAEDPSVSEGDKPEPKKRHSLLRRDKKKSRQGNVLHVNKAHVWNVGLPVSPSAILICSAFIAFYMILSWRTWVRLCGSTCFNVALAGLDLQMEC